MDLSIPLRFSPDDETFIGVCYGGVLEGAMENEFNRLALGD
ncbi:hypothetical protein [Pedobacter miscanthi]|nr:hypothetical protein [Pedobacter miscanthi]